MKCPYCGKPMYRDDLNLFRCENCYMIVSKQEIETHTPEELALFRYLELKREYEFKERSLKAIARILRLAPFEVKRRALVKEL